MSQVNASHIVGVVAAAPIITCMFGLAVLQAISWQGRVENNKEKGLQR